MERCCALPTAACPLPSSAPVMPKAGPTTSAGWPRLRPGATPARTPGMAALTDGRAGRPGTDLGRCNLSVSSARRPNRAADVLQRLLAERAEADIEAAIDLLMGALGDQHAARRSPAAVRPRAPARPARSRRPGAPPGPGRADSRAAARAS